LKPLLYNLESLKARHSLRAAVRHTAEQPRAGPACSPHPIHRRRERLHHGHLARQDTGVPEPHLSFSLSSRKGSSWPHFSESPSWGSLSCHTRIEEAPEAGSPSHLPGHVPQPQGTGEAGAAKVPCLLVPDSASEHRHLALDASVPQQGETAGS
jgi:hypothetical protein